MRFWWDFVSKVYWETSKYDDGRILLIGTKGVGLRGNVSSTLHVPTRFKNTVSFLKGVKKKPVSKWKNKNNGKSICVPSWETHIADSSPLHVEGLSKSLFFTDQRVPLLRAFNWFGWPTQLPRPFPRTLLREESVGSPVSHEELALPRQSWIRSQSPLQHLETCGTNSQVDEMAWCDGYFFCWQLIAVREKDVFFAYGKDSMKWRFCRCLSEQIVCAKKDLGLISFGRVFSFMFFRRIRSRITAGQYKVLGYVLYIPDGRHVRTLYYTGYCACEYSVFNSYFDLNALFELRWLIHSIRLV